MADAVDAQLKELRREPGNKTCFVCNERGPTYVDMDHNSFVCTTCAGIMREFAFKLKGLSMATFTSNEVKTLKASGGNEGATKAWLVRYRDSKPQPGDKDGIRTFIKDVFVSKKFVEKKKKAAESDEDEPAVKKKDTAKKATSSSSSSKTRKSSFSEEEDSKSRPRRASTTSTDSEKPVKPVKPASFRIASTSRQSSAPPAESSLLDMDFGFPSSSVQTTTVVTESFDDFVSASAPAPASKTANSAKLADPFDFGEFSSAMPASTSQQQVSKSAPPAAQNSLNDDLFGSFTAPTPSSSSLTGPPSTQTTFRPGMSSQPAPTLMPVGFQQASVPSSMSQPPSQSGMPQTLLGMSPLMPTSMPQQPPMMMGMSTQQQQQPTMMSIPQQQTQPMMMGMPQMSPQDMMQMMQSNPQMMQMMMQMMMQQQQVQQQQQPVIGGMTYAQAPSANPSSFLAGQSTNAVGGNSTAPPNGSTVQNPKNPFSGPPRPIPGVPEDLFGSFS